MKKIAVFLMTGVMVLGLTACGGGDISYDVDPEDIGLEDYDEDYGEDVYSEDENGDDDGYYEENSGEEVTYGEDGFIIDDDQIPDDAIAGYLDTWQSEINPNFFYKFDETGTWYTWDDKNSDANSNGYYELKDGNLVLYDNDGNIFETLMGYDDNTLIDSHDGNILRYSAENDPREDYGNPMENTTYEFDFDHEGPLTDIVGEWVYLGYYNTPAREDSTFEFKEDKTYYHYDVNGNVMDWGTYEFDPLGDYYETDLYLYSEYFDKATYRIMISGDLFIEDPDQYYLFRAEYKK